MGKHNLPVIVFEVTSACNLDCLYCYNIWKRNGEEFGHFNSYKKARATLKKAFKTLDCNTIAFTGGEPTLAERLPELVLYCRLKKKNVTVITNGYTNDHKRYEELFRLGVGLFELPLHSHDSAVHDAMTGKAGSHARTLQSIKYLKSLGANVVIDMVLTKKNIPYMAETLRFYAELGIDRIMFTRFNIGGRGISNAALLMPSKDALRKAFATADKLAPELGLTITSNVCTPLCVLDPADYVNIGTQSCSANVDNMPVTLDIDGNVRICNHSPVVIGNIHEQKPGEIFESGYIKSWKTVKPGYCSNCMKWDHCFGGCRAASEQIGTGLGSPDPIITMF